ncbi:polysaccharide biosynthesis protein [Loktanella sp. IMCC34160]|nr:polysaccharide biosynthesis protein [Loktanella sp. IMCC34160]
MLLIPAAFLSALFLTGEMSDATGPIAGEGLSPLLLAALFSGAVYSLALELPRIKLNAFERQAILRTIIFSALVGATTGAYSSVLGGDGLTARTIIVFTMILTIGVVSTRLLMREILNAINMRGQIRTKVLIYGAGQTGVQLVTALQHDPDVVPVAFVDDNPTLHGMMIAGLAVYPPVRIESIIKERGISRVVLAMPSISRAKQTRIARRLGALGCDVRILPSFAALVGNGPILDKIEALDPSAYLKRDGLNNADAGALCAIYHGNVIMITGAGGSIGAELCRQLLLCNPKKLVLFDVSEAALYQIGREMTDLAAMIETEIVSVLGTVTDPVGVARAIRDHKVGVILHAAAYKHVPMVEENPIAGLVNNVLGTKVVAETAVEEGVAHFVLVSTDKAVRPKSIMGASKRLAENVVQDLSAKNKSTRFSIVRFGNVLGSSGSVIPLFEEQISRGGPLTLTHQDVTRYFMTVSEAARLVLLAANYSEGGDIFVLDMGEPIRIHDLARQMIEHAGYSVRDAANPDGDIEIEVVGLRAGEKLHEDLLVDVHIDKTPHEKIIRVLEPPISELELVSLIRTISKAAERGETEIVVKAVDRWLTREYPAPKEGVARSATALADRIDIGN